MRFFMTFVCALTLAAPMALAHGDKPCCKSKKCKVQHGKKKCDHANCKGDCQKKDEAPSKSDGQPNT